MHYKYTEKMVLTLLITVFIVLLCVLLMSVKVLLTKKGQFPSSHVDANKPLREKGLRCARSQHREAVTHKDLFERMKEI